MATVGERIKTEREKQDIQQVDFAEQIGVSKQTLYKYENNIITNIPSDKIEAAAKILGVSPAMLMGWTDMKQDYAVCNSSDEVELLITYRSLEQAEKDTIHRMLAYIKAFSDKEKEVNDGDSVGIQKRKEHY